jgi:hypothetical protein
MLLHKFVSEWLSVKSVCEWLAGGKAEKWNAYPSGQIKSQIRLNTATK